MDREKLNDKAKTFVRYTHKFKKLDVLHEDENIILFKLIESSDKYKNDRNVFLIAIRSSKKVEDGWEMFSMSLNHYNNLDKIKETFKEIWNSNPENWRNKL